MTKVTGSRLTTTKVAGTAAAVTAAGMLAVAVIGNYEGLRLYAYKDVVGVWTYCYGETKGAKPGLKFTKSECDIIFIERLGEFEKYMRACLHNPDKIPDKTYVAFLSLAYNIGSTGFCKSSVAREANAGNLRQACDNLLRFTKAGGRTIQGLVTRRNSERKLCLAGLKDGVSTPVETAPIAPTVPTPVETPAPPPTLKPAAPAPVAPAKKAEPAKPAPAAKPKPAPEPEKYSYEWWNKKIREW